MLQWNPRLTALLVVAFLVVLAVANAIGHGPGAVVPGPSPGGGGGVHVLNFSW